MECSTELRGIIATVDRYGLRRRHLNKHKAEAKGLLQGMGDPIAKRYLDRIED